MFSVVTSGKKISRVLVAVLLFTVLIVTVVFTASGEGGEQSVIINGSDRESRIEFLKGLGFETDSKIDEEVKDVAIPYEFSDVYKNYNSLQQSAGYDLIPFAGKNIKQYTIKLKVDGRNDVYAHLLVYDGNIIGGDITALSVDDGYMLPLENKNKKQE